MAYEIEHLRGNHYQPLVADERFWSTLDPQYLLDGSERKCVDRIRVVFSHIPAGEGALLDIGCNIGLFCHYAQSRGLRATGIENDFHVEIKKLTDLSSHEIAKKLSGVYGLHPEFIKGDYLEEIKGRTWDFILYLSVWHHHVMGYGGSGRQKMTADQADDVLRQVWAATNKILFFETDTYMRVAEITSGQSRVKKAIKAVLGPVAVMKIYKLIRFFRPAKPLISADELKNKITSLLGVEPEPIFESWDGWNPRIIWMIRKSD